MIYPELFLSFLQIGIFSFGGGYAAMPLIQEQVISRHHWLTLTEFTDLVSIAEMTPGPIAINGATFVGNQTAGILGALAATAGFILPSCVFVTILAFLYSRYRGLRLMQGVLKYLRPAVVAMILAAGVTILLSVVFKSGQVNLTGDNIEIRGILIFLAAFIALRRTKLNPILIMTGCGVIELVCQAVMR